MSTCSVIAGPILDSWEGRYCHYHGYPAHQGRVLHEAVTGHFAGDVEAARRYLIDEHPPAGPTWAATSQAGRLR